MKVKTWSNSEEYLYHCIWKLSEDCEDLNTTRAMLEEAKVKANVEKVSSGACSSCAKILNKKTR